MNVNSLLRSVFAVAVAVGFLGACTSDQNLNVHPLLVNYKDDAAQSVAVSSIVGVDAASSRVDDYGIFNKSVLRADVGAGTGTDSPLFGKIEDIEVLGPDGFALLDSRNSKVSIFDWDGNEVSSFGTPGVGPNEMQYPNAISAIGDSLLLVLDRNTNVIRYGKNSDGQFVENNRFQVAVAPWDMCANRQSISIWGVSESEHSVVWQYDVSGTIRQSYGSVYNTPNRMVRFAYASQGFIGCSSTESLTFVAPQHLPFVSAYSEEGSLVWQSLIDNAIETEVTETDQNGRQGVRISPPQSSGTLWLRSLKPISDKRIVLSYGVAGLEGKSRIIVLDELSGRALFSTNISGYFGGMHDNKMVSWDNSPYPHFMIQSVPK